MDITMTALDDVISVGTNKDDLQADEAIDDGTGPQGGVEHQGKNSSTADVDEAHHHQGVI